MCIGGLRNTSESLNKLSFTAAYGLKLGESLKKTLDEHPEWIDQTCNAIGSNDDERMATGLDPLRPHPEQLAKYAEWSENM